MFIVNKSFHPKAIEFESQMIKNQKKNQKTKLKEKHKQKILSNTTTTLRIFKLYYATTTIWPCTILYNLPYIIYHRFFTKIFKNCAFLYYVRLGLSTLYIFSLYEYENICYIYLCTDHTYVQSIQKCIKISQLKLNPVKKRKDHRNF